MSVHTEYYSVIIPIEKIKTCQSVRGFVGILEMKKDDIGGRIYFDDYLYRDGAMGPMDVEDIVEFWKEQGLEPFEERDGEQYWKDLCVVDMFGGPTLPCDWLEFERLDYVGGGGSISHVFIKGKPKGKLIHSTRFTNLEAYLPKP